MKFPALTFYTENLAEGFGGQTTGPIVKIRPKYKDDKGLHEHEYEHVNQWWITTLISAALYYALYYFQGAPIEMLPLVVAVYSLLYEVVPWFKLKMEVAAYKVQNACYPDDRSSFFAWVVSTKYGLKDVDVAEVQKQIKA